MPSPYSKFQKLLEVSGYDVGTVLAILPQHNHITDCYQLCHVHHIKV